MDKTPPELLRKQRKILRQMRGNGDILRGSLLERYRKCGKPSCHCSSPGEKGHRLVYLSVTLTKGKTEQVSLPPQWVGYAKSWIKNYDRLWKSLEALSDLNRDWLRQARKTQRK